MMFSLRKLTLISATDAATGEQFTSDQASACSNSGYDTARDAHMIISKSKLESSYKTHLLCVSCLNILYTNHIKSFFKEIVYSISFMCCLFKAEKPC